MLQRLEIHRSDNGKYSRRDRALATRKAVRETIMQISYVNVFVTDLERAITFFRDQLGLDLQFSSPEHGYASFSAGSVRLGIALPGTDHADLVGRHTGVGLGVADLEAEHRRLSALGVRFTMAPTRQEWGGLMAMISDADGNIFYLDQESAAHS